LLITNSLGIGTNDVYHIERIVDAWCFERYSLAKILNGKLEAFLNISGVSF